MAAERKPAVSRSPRRPPARTPEAREQQLISLATELAEKQLADGTASAQVITHYLKMATGREQLEREKLARENELLRARSEALAQNGRLEELFDSAIKAMSSYQGREDFSEEDYYA